ncbi:MAG: DUF72 domain-containing protein [Persicimonas sp.]
MSNESLFEAVGPDWNPPHEGLYLGTAGWSYDDWNGVFYPPGTSQTDRLVHYASHFRTVEIDSTFYATPSRTTVQSWHRRAPEGFVFSAKFPRDITHRARLVGCGAEAATFIDVMTELGEHMGPLLVQLPPSFTVEAFDDLARFLEGLPDGHMYAVEVRHRSWLIDEYAELLKRWRVAMVLTCGGRLGRFWRATSRIAYLRWLGGHDSFERYDRIQRSRDDEIAWWAPRMAHFLDRGGTVFGYVNNNYEGFSPETVGRIEERVGEALSDSTRE